MEPRAVEQMISDVSRARIFLASLAIENISAERMARCERCVSDLETAVSEVVSLPWVPRDVPQLMASIQAMSMNLRRVRDGIDAALDVFEREAPPDELLHVCVAMMMQRVLEFQLSVMQETLAKIVPQAEYLN